MIVCLFVGLAFLSIGVALRSWRALAIALLAPLVWLIGVGAGVWQAGFDDDQTTIAVAILVTAGVAGLAGVAVGRRLLGPVE